MGQTFLTSVDIVRVRQLQNIRISLSEENRKYLIFTGINGCGKTFVLNSLFEFLGFLVSDNFYSREGIQNNFRLFSSILQNGSTEEEKCKVQQQKKGIEFGRERMCHWTDGAVASCTSFSTLREKYVNGQFIIAYYKADRQSKVEIPSTIESIQLKDKYDLGETPGKKLVKYMVSLKATQAFALQKGDKKRSAEIDDWFNRFEGVLKKIFDDPTLHLDFDIDNFQFHILQDNREPFDFNTMSSGYSAVFDIITDLMMRMERKNNYSTEGVVLIDEIETHLHLELQRAILPFLTELFPNIQFIVTTHSPFVLNSIDNAVIYDLETQKLVEDGLTNYPYDGIVEGYFHADKLSSDLRAKFSRYKDLVGKLELTDEDYAEIVELEQVLDEIPDYLSSEIASEYSRLKLEFSNRR